MTKRGYIRLFSYAIAFALLLSSRAIINMTIHTKRSLN